MELHQLVEINEAGLIANAVNFGMMADPEQNRQLCEGFVFNYDRDPKKQKNTTLGILDALRRSFHSRSEPNIHLLIQDYGKGKSHFALTVANFFSKPADSPEIQGILHQIERATHADAPILTALRSLKQRGRHLVICLSGERTINLKKQLLQALTEVLDREGVKDAIAQQLCKTPLDFLNKLTPDQEAIAQTWLATHNTELAELQDQLENHNYEVISTAIALGQHLVGFKPDFETDVDVEIILKDVIDRLCHEPDSPFQGVVILFDELYNYLQTWSADPVNAGGMTLQNITNVCENNKGKIALLCLTQKSLNSYTPKQEIDSYQRLATRLELKDSTYEPIASLELVIKGLFNQKEETAAWAEFHKTHNNTLTALNVEVYRDRTANYYESRNWKPEDLYKHLTIGCFPLHPLTTYLLCNLDFAQGRTAIQFAHSEAKDFINQEPVTKDGRLNLIYPVALMKFFAKNFEAVHQHKYSNYQKTLDQISASITPEEKIILQGILLYNIASSMTQNTRQLLQKLALEPHEVLLSHLTGYPETKVKTLTKQLTQNHKVIRYSESDHTYRFYEGGLGIIDFLERVKEKVGTRRAGIDRVRDYLMMADGIEVLGGELASPNAFITDHKLAKNDWQIPQVVQTDRDFRQLLSSTNTLEKEIAQVIYVIADSSEVLTRLQTEINQRLTPKDVNDLNAIQRRLVVCVSQQPADELAQVLFWLEIARQEKIQEWGAAKNEGIKELEEQRDRMLKSLFQNCTYHCHADYKIPESDRKNLNRVLSALFNELYPFVPSVANVDKMAVKKSNSSTTIGNICKRLLNNDFITIEKPQKNVLDPVLVSDWGLLTKTSETYLINEPKNPTIKVAWDYISDLTAVKSKKETLIYLDQLWQTLRQPPYGYNENTFAVLLSAWLAFHHAEVVLRGSFGIPKGKQQVWTQTEPIRAWGKTSVFDKPKELIEKWILPQGKKNKVRPVLVRRQVQPVPQLPATVDYGEARDRWIPTLKTYLENPDDTAPIADLQAQLKDLERAIATLQAPLTAIDDTEALPDQPDLKTVIPLMVQFETALKPVEQEFVTVCPTEADRDRSKGARQRLREILSAFIDEQRAIVATLTTVADCHDHLGNLEDYQQQIAQVHGGRWGEYLTEIQQETKKRLNEITEGNKLQQAIDTVDQRHRALSDNATQSDYADCLLYIEQLAQEIPALKREAQYAEAIAAIQAHQTALTEQLTAWQQQDIEHLSPAAAFALSNTLSTHANRYTDPDSQAQLVPLRDRLQAHILAADPEPPPVVAPDPDAPLIHQLQTWNLSPTASCHDCETAIAHLETLRDQLQHPEPHHGTINGHIQTAQKRIATLTATLDQWRDRLSQAQTLADIRTLQAGVQSLELAFRNSAVFPQYQALQTTIQKRHQDCDRLQTLTQTINTSQTLAQCEANRLTLQDQAGQFHHPDEFADAIAQLHQRLQDRIHKAHTALNQYQETLATLTTLHQAQAQRDELLKRSGHYQKSELEARYQHLNDETKALINLFQLYERKQQRTPQDCDDLRQQLDAWLNTVDLTETLDHHFKRLSQEIQEKRDRLHQKQEHQAREWVKSIANEMVKINTGSDLHAQSEQSQRILHNITQEQPKYLAYLTRESHETLAKIRQTCQRLIDVNTTQTIERLFQELSPPERQTLYTKLRTYL